MGICICEPFDVWIIIQFDFADSLFFFLREGEPITNGLPSDQDSPRVSHCCKPHSTRPAHSHSLVVIKLSANTP